MLCKQSDFELLNFQLIDSNVTVHTIAITDQADVKMDGLGAATGGLTFIHRDTDRGNDIGTAFSEIANYEDSKSGISIGLQY